MIPVLHLGSGKDFGELALKIDKTNPTKIAARAATVVCLTDCKFATMRKQDYQSILDKIDQKNFEKLVSFFKNVPFM
jgi:CRP-like cAMP-binding protein